MVVKVSGNVTVDQSAPGQLKDPSISVGLSKTVGQPFSICEEESDPRERRGKRKKQEFVGPAIQQGASSKRSVPKSVEQIISLRVAELVGASTRCVTVGSTATVLYELDVLIKRRDVRDQW